jgi:hypothetical protein
VTDSMESKDWVGQMASNISREGNNGILKLEAENFERSDDQRVVMILPHFLILMSASISVLGCLASVADCRLSLEA